MFVHQFSSDELRVLLPESSADDSDISHKLFIQNGIQSVSCASVRVLCAELQRGAAALILPEETIGGPDSDALFECLRGQPVWSDLPIIVLSRAGEQSGSIEALLARLGNASIVERPVRGSTLLSVVRTALRARQRQYQVRQQIISAEENVAALRNAADELERQRQIFENVASGTPDFIYTFDLSEDPRLRYANRRLLEVLGVPTLGADGMTLASLGYPKWHVEMHAREIAEVISTRRPIVGEVPFTGQSGIFGVYEYIFTPVFAADGTVEAIAGTTRDVTARKRIEERDRFLLRIDEVTRRLVDADAISRETVKLLAEHLNVDRCAYADFLEDEDTFIFAADYCRNGVPTIVGRYRCTTDLGKFAYERFRSGQSDIIEDVDTAAIDEAIKDNYRGLQIGAVISVPLLRDGKLVGGLGVHQSAPREWRVDEIDLAKLTAARCWEAIHRARVARDLTDSEQRLRLAVETGRLGIWELDLRTHEMTSSDRCKQMYGRPLDQPFTFEELWQSIDRDDFDRVQAAFRRALDRRLDYSVEYRVPLAEGTRWVLVRGRATYAGAVPGRMVGVSLDITDRKTEEERRARSLTIEQTARKAAERASQLKDDFLATLSHELRTPLSAILGWAQILRRGPQKPEALKDGLATIERNARAQTQIIEDLLDMSRIMSGKVSLEAKPIDLAAVIRAAVETVEPTSVAKDISIDFIPPNVPLMMSGDPNRLQQVFWNLLSNAVKFTPRTGRVTVHTEADRAGWRVDVVDTGEGIRADFLPHVFDRFRQADSSTTRQHGGLGLGLAIVKQLAELHGGTVSARSEGVGAGTTMSVWLPALIEREHFATVAASPSAFVDDDANSRLNAHELGNGWPGSQYRSMSGKRAVIVDDEPDARALLRRVLEECSVTVYDAPSAEAAYQLIARERPDVLVSDVGMPGEDGHSLIRRVRALPPDRGGITPAIALTAYARNDDRQKAIEAGFNAHVSKPLEPSVFIAAVAALVGQSDEGTSRRPGETRDE